MQIKGLGFWQAGRFWLFPEAMFDFEAATTCRIFQQSVRSDPVQTMFLHLPLWLISDAIKR